MTFNADFYPEVGASCENPTFINDPLVVGTAAAGQLGDPPRPTPDHRRASPPRPRRRPDGTPEPEHAQPTTSSTEPADVEAPRRPRPGAARWSRCWSRSSPSGCWRSAAGWRWRWASGGPSSPRRGLGRRRVRPGHVPAPPAGRGDGQPGGRPQHRPRRPAAGLRHRLHPDQPGGPDAGLADALGPAAHQRRTRWRWMDDAAMPGTTCPGTASSTGSADGAVMPGMATEAELAQLRSLSGTAFDVMFLQLMIRHHQGGLEMAQYGQQHAGEARRAGPGAVDRGDADGGDRRRWSRCSAPAAAARSRLPEAPADRPGAAGNVSRRRARQAPAMTSPRSSGDRALPSGGRGAGSNPAGGTTSPGSHRTHRPPGPSAAAGGVVSGQPACTRPAVTSKRRVVCTASSIRRSWVTSSSVPG